MFPRLVRFNNTDETYGLVPTTESSKPLSVAISLMVIIGNICIMGYRGKGGVCTDEQTSHCFGPLSFIMLPFPSLPIACSMKGSFFRSISYNEGCMNEWMNEWKKEKKERKKWEKLGGNFRTIHWNCQLTSAEKGSTFSWALTYMGGGGYHFHGFQHRYYDD